MDDRIRLDHVVIAVTDWERSNGFYRDVLGAEVVERGAGYAYRIGDIQLNVHGPGLSVQQLASIPVPPGGSDLCFEWRGPIGGRRGAGTSVYFRDPDGSLLELLSYV